MYNGIGLTTARGSGTNGYVQRNWASVRKTKDSVNYRTEEEIAKLDSASNKQPNREILDHERKRKIEVKCAELEDSLEEQGLPKEEIAARVAAFRAKISETAGGDKDVPRDEFGRVAVRETHAVAEAQQEKNARLRDAFGISPRFVEGTSLDAERRAREHAQRYPLVRTPSHERERTEHVAKKKKKRSVSPETKKLKKKKSKKNKKEKQESSKKKKKRSKSPDTDSSSSSDASQDSDSGSSDDNKHKKKKKKKSSGRRRGTSEPSTRESSPVKNKKSSKDIHCESASEYKENDVQHRKRDRDREVRNKKYEKRDDAPAQSVRRQEDVTQRQDDSARRQDNKVRRREDSVRRQDDSARRHNDRTRRHERSASPACRSPSPDYRRKSHVTKVENKRREPSRDENERSKPLKRTKRDRHSSSDSVIDQMSPSSRADKRDKRQYHRDTSLSPPPEKRRRSSPSPEYRKKENNSYSKKVKDGNETRRETSREDRIQRSESLDHRKRRQESNERKEREDRYEKNSKDNRDRYEKEPPRRNKNDSIDEHSRRRKNRSPSIESRCSPRSPEYRDRSPDGKKVSARSGTHRESSSRDDRRAQRRSESLNYRTRRGQSHERKERKDKYEKKNRSNQDHYEEESPRRKDNDSYDEQPRRKKNRSPSIDRRHSSPEYRDRSPSNRAYKNKDSHKEPERYYKLDKYNSTSKPAENKRESSHSKKKSSTPEERSRRRTSPSRSKSRSPPRKMSKKGKRKNDVPKDKRSSERRTLSPKVDHRNRNDKDRSHDRRESHRGRSRSRSTKRSRSTSSLSYSPARRSPERYRDIIEKLPEKDKRKYIKSPSDLQPAKKKSKDVGYKPIAVCMRTSSSENDDSDDDFRIDDKLLRDELDIPDLSSLKRKLTLMAKASMERQRNAELDGPSTSQAGREDVACKEDRDKKNSVSPVPVNQKEQSPPEVEEVIKIQEKPTSPKKEKSQPKIESSPDRNKRSRSGSWSRSSSARSRSRSRSRGKSSRSKSRSRSRSHSSRSRSRSYSSSRRSRSSRSSSYSSRSSSRSSRSSSRSTRSSRTMTGVYADYRRSSGARSRSRSPSIPRRAGSPSFLDRRRITSARKRPIPYRRPTPSTPSSNSYYSSESSQRSWSGSPRPDRD